MNSIKYNIVKQSGKICPECKNYMRVYTYINEANEIEKVWTCPECHNRIRKVNVAATKRMRELNVN